MVFSLRSSLTYLIKYRGLILENEPLKTHLPYVISFTHYMKAIPTTTRNTTTSETYPIQKNTLMDEPLTICVCWIPLAMPNTPK